MLLKNLQIFAVFTLCLFFTLLSGCDIKTLFGPPVSQTKSSVFETINQSVFEVITPRKTEAQTEYFSAIPWDKLPYSMRNDRYDSLGSAFSIELGKYISAAHVFEAPFYPTPRTFYLRDSHQSVYEIDQITRFSLHRDLIEFTLKISKTLPSLHHSRTTHLGEAVYSIGNAHGEGISIREGIISSHTQEPLEGEWDNIRFSAAASPGNSGGPLVNEKGEVIGVILQKSPNENLNVAIPITEVGKLAPKTAQFKKRFFAQLVGKSFSQTLDYGLALPKSQAEFQSISYQTYWDKIEEIRSQVLLEFQDELFPKHKNSPLYLQNQVVSDEWSLMSRDPSDQWVSINPEFSRLEFPDGAKVSYFKNSNFNYPSPFALGGIFESQSDTASNSILDLKEAIDHILLAGEYGFPFAGVPIRLKALPLPVAKELFQDHLDRPWVLQVFREDTPFSWSIVSYCLPLPKGSACLVSPLLPRKAEVEYLGTQIKTELANWQISYSGTFSQWLKFKALDSQYVPPLIRDKTQIHWDKSEFKMRIGDLEFFIPSALIHSEDTLTSHLIYGRNNPSELSVSGFGWLRKEEKESYDSLLFEKPYPNSAESIRKVWKDSLNRKLPYNGTLQKEGRQLSLILVGIPTPDRTSLKFKPNSKITRLARIFCKSESEGSKKDSETQFQNLCKNLITHLKISQ